MSQFEVIYSVETNYRLYLLSDMFRQYEKILYLDCNLVVCHDISELLNLHNIRKTTNEKKAIRVLVEHEFTYNDQDVMNYIIKGQYKYYDVTWNYQNGYDIVSK